MGLFSKKDPIQELSQRWITEGKQFKNQLNAFLDAIYKGGEGPEEPHESREDMAQTIYGLAVEMNESGEHQKLRELFPPAYEPFQAYYDGISRSINQVIVLKDGRIIARADGNVYVDDGNVYLLEDNKITEQQGVMAIGISSNKEFVAKVTDSAIFIHADWDSAPIHTFEYPKGYGDITATIPISDFKEEGLIVLSIDVFNDGKRVLLATTNGIFILSEKGSDCLLPTQEMLPQFIESFYEEYEESVPFEVSLDYFHAKLSPDNKKIATGFQMSQHFILEEKDKGFELVGTIQARSEYPHAVGFHDKLDHIALASCHYQQSGVVGMDLKNLPIETNASWYQDFDERLDFIHDNMWVYAILPYKDGYFLGANNGYIWYINPKNPNDKAYIHLGGTIMSMDYSVDKKYLVIGTYSGYVIKLDLTVSERDESLVTNMNVKETNRWVIWKGSAPLIW